MDKYTIAYERVKELETEVFLYKLRINELEALVELLQAQLLRKDF